MPDEKDLLNSGSTLAFLTLIGMLVIFAITGFFLGLIVASFFSLIAQKNGGLEIDIEQ